MKADPSYDEYMRRWTAAYETTNYDNGMAAYFLSMSHVWCEQEFGPDTHFSRVLEVGAGTGFHIRTVRHTFDEYMMTDLNPPMLDQIQIPAGLGRITSGVKRRVGTTTKGWIRHIHRRSHPGWTMCSSHTSPHMYCKNPNTRQR